MIWIIHIIAFCFCMPALLITIPLHILIDATEVNDSGKEW